MKIERISTAVGATLLVLGMQSVAHGQIPDPPEHCKGKSHRYLIENCRSHWDAVIEIRSIYCDENPRDRACRAWSSPGNSILAREAWVYGPWYTPRWTPEQKRENDRHRARHIAWKKKEQQESCDTIFGCAAEVLLEKRAEEAAAKRKLEAAQATRREQERKAQEEVTRRAQEAEAQQRLEEEHRAQEDARVAWIDRLPFIAGGLHGLAGLLASLFVWQRIKAGNWPDQQTRLVFQKLHWTRFYVISIPAAIVAAFLAAALLGPSAEGQAWIGWHWLIGASAGLVLAFIGQYLTAHLHIFLPTSGKRQVGPRGKEPAHPAAPQSPPFDPGISEDW